MLAEKLLKIGAISFSLNPPFTWTSGIKSPVYCDNRMNISSLENRELIIEGMIGIIQKHYPTTTLIAGTSTAGIPWASFIADRLNLPMVYIRGKAKEHGKGKRIEGIVKDTDKVVIIEDLISTGKSSLEAVEAMKEDTKSNVLGVIAIFTYDLDISKKKFEEAKVKYNTLENFNNLLDIAISQNIIPKEQKEIVLAWKKNPENWNPNI